MNNQNSVVTREENSPNAQYSNVKIIKYGFYISRQGSYDLDHRYSEVSAILDLYIPEIKIDDKPIEKIEVFFFAEGSPSEKTKYSERKIHLEFKDTYLNFWLSGLSNPHKNLDIGYIDQNFVRLFLYSSSAGE